MTATSQRRVAAFLHHAGLLAAVLAVIGGILGMHVMTGNHSVHAPAATAGPATETAQPGHFNSVSGHSGHSTPDGLSMAPEAGVHAPSLAAAQCPDPAGCPEMQAMAPGCIPAANTASLAAPLPGTAVLTVDTKTGPFLARAAGWSYLPGSPSPGQLCISRT
ncbi:hypothetical protein ACOM2C_06075 [Pseudarthrobacter sp. So.54]